VWHCLFHIVVGLLVSGASYVCSTRGLAVQVIYF
jgi:hypothetical protein